MDGLVQSHQASLAVPVVVSGQPDLSIEYVIDTGFVGFLTLPLAAVQALGLPFLRRTSANLADDTTIRVPIHTMVIRWHGV